jgi:hypothetical protein
MRQIVNGTPLDTEGRSLKEIAVQWLAAQGASTVLLTGILCAIAYGGYYGMHTAVPAHLDQIQKGYTELGERHEKVVERIITAQDKEREALYRLVEKDRDTRPSSGIQ